MQTNLRSDAFLCDAMERCGVPTAPWRDITAYTEADIPQLVEELEVPCAVKIVNGGSSTA